MSVTLAAVLFAGLVTGWFLLAFLPALRELRHGVDAGALPVAADGRTSPSYFAERFRRVLMDRLAGPAEEARLSNQTLIGEIDHEERFVVLPPRHRTLNTDEGLTIDALVLALGDLDVDEDMTLTREAYVEGSLRTGARAMLRATLAEGDVELGESTTSLRWLHGTGSIRADRNCRLYGRVSADGILALAEGTAFERLHAPTIEFGAPTIEDRAPIERRFHDFESLGSRVEVAGGRTRIEGDVTIPEHVLVRGDLVVTGRLEIGKGARIEGNVKVYGGRVDEAVEIEGALVSARGLEIGTGSRIRGPVFVEENLRIGTACAIGRADLPTTVRCERLDVSTGTVVHGTVWTHEGGGEVRS